MTFRDLRNLNIAWCDDDFVTVYSLVDFLSDGDMDKPPLRLRFALSIYGARLVRRFNGNTIWVE